MDFSVSEEQVMLRDVAERFVREHYPLETRRRFIASEAGFDAENWRRFAELGWLGLSLPEDCGGLGDASVELAILMAALGRGCILEPYVPTAVLGARILERSSARTLLPAIGTGDLRLALAHDEAGDRSNPHQPRRTTARSAASGFRLSGTKTMALGGPSADRLIVSAVIPGDPGFSLFLVERAAVADGLTAYPLVDGTRAADVALRDLPVGPETLIVPAPGAAAVLTDAIDRATLAYLAEAVGSMEACLDLCSEYLKSRRQFGQAIGKFQALQHIMAEMFVEAQEARSILYQCLSEINGTPATRRLAVSMAKVVIGQAAKIIARQGVQLHGGYGITDEYAISHHYKRLMVIEQLFGDSDDHAMRVAALSISGDDMQECARRSA